MGRQQLLASAIGHVRENGIAHQSLREIADAIGSSHRMLLYHFGSREGLLAAVVADNEQAERAATEKLIAAARSPKDALRSSWRRLQQPNRAGEERLFFELAAMAMYEHPGTERVADDLVNRWMELARSTRTDAANIRLDIAVMRGLLLDLLLTGDRSGTDAAFERYVAMRTATPARQSRQRT